jgi:hypothetical protein
MNTNPIRTLRPNGTYAYTVSPLCVREPAPHQYPIDLDFYYLAQLANIVGFVDPAQAFHAGRREAVPYVTIL